MNLTINLPNEKIKLFVKLVKEWKDLSIKPLTNCKKLSQIEKEIALQLTYTILQDQEWSKELYEHTESNDKA